MIAPSLSTEITTMNSAVLFLLCTYALVEVHSTTAPYITFMGETLRNNSYVDLSLVGNDASGSDSIQCHSDLSSDGGAWFSPDGESITTTITEDIYQVRQDNRIDLRHRRNGKVSGMYRCEVDTVAAPSIGNSRTDITNTEFVYVGLYTSGGTTFVTQTTKPIHVLFSLSSCALTIP